MKNGLGALARALDTLGTYAVADDIPINDPQVVTGIVEDGKDALDDVRELIRATRALYTQFIAPLAEEPETREARDVIDVLDRLTKGREQVQA